jgi:hypothetical protein
LGLGSSSGVWFNLTCIMGWVVVRFGLHSGLLLRPTTDVNCTCIQLVGRGRKGWLGEDRVVFVSSDPSPGHS